MNIVNGISETEDSSDRSDYTRVGRVHTELEVGARTPSGGFVGARTPSGGYVSDPGENTFRDENQVRIGVSKVGEVEGFETGDGRIE